MVVENYGGKPTLVWSLVVLKDLTVISGDSLGHVQVGVVTRTPLLPVVFGGQVTAIPSLVVSLCMALCRYGKARTAL